MTTWLKDDKGNKCSVEYFGSKRAAQKALDSLENCKNCTNCQGCKNCSDCRSCSSCSDCRYCSSCRYCSDCRYCSSCSSCSDCSYCSDCRYCSSCRYCSYCSSCRYCSDCSSCSDCRYCRYCSYCSSCRYCSDCSSCSDCRYCSDCSSCSDCSYCSDCRYCSSCRYCSDCSDCSYCRLGKKIEGTEKRVEIPRIENIHQRVYEAVSQPNALNMGSWHACDTTHCRAGWVVTLAGEAGKALEKFHDTCLAAALIYRESSPIAVSLIRFFDNDKDAMADMEKMAKLEAQAA